MSTPPLVVTQGVHCAFCGEPAGIQAGRPALAGPAAVICVVCVDRAHRMLHDSTAASPSEREELTVELLEDVLRRGARARSDGERQLGAWVAQAREAGMSWAAIGEAMGMTRQSAWERFKSSVADAGTGRG